MVRLGIDNIDNEITIWVGRIAQLVKATTQGSTPKINNQNISFHPFKGGK